MIAIGLWAVQQRGTARAATPLGFVAGAACGLLAGRVLGLGAIASAWLAASTVAVGVAVALALRPGATLAPLAAFGLGFVHGHAHVADLATSLAPGPFAAGFLLATASLHALGFGIARMLPARARDAAAALGGGAIAAAGLVLLVAG